MLANIPRPMLISAISRRYPSMPAQWAEHISRLLISELDPRLEVNVAEWIADQPLTDVWIAAGDGRRFSVDTVMSIHGNQDFVDAILTLNILAQGDDELALSQIYRTLL